MPIQIAIDGPVGAGKTTISKEAAKRLGFLYMDTGALYRAIGVYCILNDIDSNNEKAVNAVLEKIKLEIRLSAGEQLIYVNNVDVTDRLRMPAVSMIASQVSSYGQVREFLLDLQRGFAEKNNIIMDGRDIGTVILPNADVKIFLWADPKERANRRFIELKEKGSPVTFEEVFEDLKKRDANDSTRSHAPLKQAADAIKLDTTHNTFEQSIDLVVETIKNKLGMK